PDRPGGVVLVLHGGAGRRRNKMVSPAQLSVLRMIPIAARIARRGQGRLAVFRLLNSVRGWDNEHTPVDDARWALGQIRQRLGAGAPICLVGHSLGGRAALLACAEPGVRSAVALAPWVYPTDVAEGRPGRQILIVHGTADRIARPANSAAVAEALARRGPVGYVRIAGGKHAMLKHHGEFDGLAADFAVATLLGDDVGGAVGRVLAGERWIDG
ncbi:MAG: alpha/beta hydrolase, partial [Frankiales bacterium]|nr:alpha/beta hydrolase [Frankiales bacterium]